jgi:flavodoxin
MRFIDSSEARIPVIMSMIKEISSVESEGARRVLVAYLSQTGNTKKVAEAIYEVLPEPKEIKPIREVTTLDGYDISFLGFPIHKLGPDEQEKAYLEKLTKNRTIALFITHMAPEEAPELEEWLQKFRDAAANANIVGMFHCQGQASWLVKFILRFAPDPVLREARKKDKSNGKPDAIRLERARVFAKEMIKEFQMSNVFVGSRYEHVMETKAK